LSDLDDDSHRALYTLQNTTMGISPIKSKVMVFK